MTMDKDKIEGTEDNVVYLDEYRRAIEEERKEEEEKRKSIEEQESYFLMDDLSSMSKGDAKRFTDSVMALIETLAGIDHIDDPTDDVSERPPFVDYQDRDLSEEENGVEAQNNKSIKTDTTGRKTTIIAIPLHPLDTFMSEGIKRYQDKERNSIDKDNTQEEEGDIEE